MTACGLCANTPEEGHHESCVKNARELSRLRRCFANVMEDLKGMREQLDVARGVTSLVRR